MEGDNYPVPMDYDAPVPATRSAAHTLRHPILDGRCDFMSG